MYVCRAQIALWRKLVAPAPIRCAARFLFTPAIQRSPNWHRHLRKRRSKAWRAFSKGRSLGADRQELLLRHHATSEVDRDSIRSFMGKQGWSKGGGEYAGARWQVWPGAWASSPQQPRAPWRQQNKFHFPAYDEKPVVHDAGRTPNVHLSVEQDQQESGLGGMQKLVNVARKAEQKLVRLQADKDKSALQWQQYQKDLQLAFNRERKRHIQAQEQFEKDIAMAGEKQEEARANIRNYAATFASRGSAAEREEDGPSWEEMTRSWIEEEDGAIEGVLHRALSSRTREPEPRTPSMRRPAAARTPTLTRRSEGSAPPFSGGTLFTYATEELASAKSDPYPHVQSPPSSGPAVPEHSGGDVEMDEARRGHEGLRPEAKVSPTHPGQRDFAAQRVPTTEAPPRLDVKSATKNTVASVAVHSQLGQKLEAKRHAMKPFGVGMAPTDLPHGGPPSESSTGDPTRSSGLLGALVDDDNEELEEADRSPGFGNLE